MSIGCTQEYTKRWFTGLRKTWEGSISQVTPLYAIAFSTLFNLSFLFYFKFQLLPIPQDKKLSEDNVKDLSVDLQVTYECFSLFIDTLFVH